MPARYRYYDYEFERYWHFFQLSGRLGYNPDTPAEVWQREFRRRFGAAAPTSRPACTALAGAADDRGLGVPVLRFPDDARLGRAPEPRRVARRYADNEG